MKDTNTFKLTIAIPPTITIPPTEDMHKKVIVIDGLPKLSTVISIEDLKQIIPTEQYLEKLFGYRFHIDVR